LEGLRVAAWAPHKVYKGMHKVANHLFTKPFVSPSAMHFISFDHPDNFQPIPININTNVFMFINH
jgi:hypothetical protein